MGITEEEFAAMRARIDAQAKAKKKTPLLTAAVELSKAGFKPAKKRNKYGAKRVQIDGIWFDSKREGERYGELKLLEKAGAIRNLKVHPRWELTVNDTYIGRYTADFAYQLWKLPRIEAFAPSPGRWIDMVEDVKSKPTAKSREFRRTLKLMKAIYGIEIKVVL